jgi:hypothetical protein
MVRMVSGFNPRVRLALLSLRIEDAERTNEHIHGGQSMRSISRLATDRFFFVAAATIRVGWASGESDDIESSDSWSWTLEERVLRAALAGAGWALALPLARAWLELARVCSTSASKIGDGARESCLCCTSLGGGRSSSYSSTSISGGPSSDISIVTSMSSLAAFHCVLFALGGKCCDLSRADLPSKGDEAVSSYSNSSSWDM